MNNNNKKCETRAGGYANHEGRGSHVLAETSKKLYAAAWPRTASKVQKREMHARLCGVLTPTARKTLASWGKTRPTHPPYHSPRHPSRRPPYSTRPQLSRLPSTRNTPPVPSPQLPDTLDTYTPAFGSSRILSEVVLQLVDAGVG